MHSMVLLRGRASRRGLPPDLSPVFLRNPRAPAGPVDENRPVAGSVAPRRNLREGGRDGGVRAARARADLVRRSRRRGAAGAPPRWPRGRAVLRAEPRGAGPGVPRLYAGAAWPRAYARRRGADHVPADGG